MSGFKIEKSVPKPAPIRRRKYPWLEMEIGDSFLVPGGRTERLANSAHGAGKRYGRKFSTRSVEGGVRVWRDA